MILISSFLAYFYKMKWFAVCFSQTKKVGNICLIEFYWEKYHLCDMMGQTSRVCNAPQSLSESSWATNSFNGVTTVARWRQFRHENLTAGRVRHKSRRSADKSFARSTRVIGACNGIMESEKNSLCVWHWELAHSACRPEKFSPSHGFFCVALMWH